MSQASGIEWLVEFKSHTCKADAEPSASASRDEEQLGLESHEWL